jgi:predicted GIY-YIG superfamily endonuclease
LSGALLSVRSIATEIHNAAPSAIMHAGFTIKYKLDRLVYFEKGGDVLGAIEREKQLKGWRRSKKLALIESINPKWKDLSLEWG